MDSHLPPARPELESRLPVAAPVGPRPGRGGKRLRAAGHLLLFLAVFLAGMGAQTLALAPGLAWSEVFVFLLPAVIAAEGSNLRAGEVLLLARRPRPAEVALALGTGVASFFFAGAVMALWTLVLPRSLVERDDVTRLFLGPESRRIVLGILASVVAPVCEETAFRGYVLGRLRARLPPRWAILGSALLFALFHLDPVRFPALVILGSVYGWLAWRSGSVWTAVVAHAANNAIASVLASIQSPAALERAGSSSDALATLGVLALGGAALWLASAAYRAVTPLPPRFDLAELRRDPGDGSVRFRLSRVPLPLWSAALVGLLLLMAIGAGARATGG